MGKAEDHGRLDSEGDDNETVPLPPGIWRRHDLGVLVVALAILLIGTLVHRRLTSPTLIDFEHEGLQFQRPAGWLPGVQPPSHRAGLATASVGFEVARAEVGRRDARLFHILYSSAQDPKQRIEVRIGPRPAYRNLRGALSVERIGKYGEFYWVRSSDEESIARRDWIRTHYRYAFKHDKAGSPQIAEAVEYATLDDNRLYVVTLHGSPNEMGGLDQRLAASLRLKPPTRGARP